MDEEIELGIQDCEALAVRACLGAGADERSARALASATVSAARFGPASLGFPHLLDYLASFREGRINRQPRPKIDRPYPAFITLDADKGIAQLGFDLAFDDLVEAARTLGVAIFTQSNSYPAGELGYYVRRLSDFGLIGLGATNANAMMAASPGGSRAYSTNPVALAYPLGEGAPPLLIDQSSSATAYVNIRSAAQEGRSIPSGWAIDESGVDTQDPNAALAGALLPFGGRKGANIALLIEMLSAGLSGGNWSLDAPSFEAGNDCPSVGLTVIAIAANPNADSHHSRAAEQVARLRELGVYIPGVSSADRKSALIDTCKMSKAVHDALRKFAAEYSSSEPLRGI